jgi:hypothetical protein
MRFLMIYTPAEEAIRKHEAGVPPTPQEIAVMGKLIEEMAKAGVLLSTEGCQPTSKGAKVKKSGKDIKVTDGPFTEAKEVVGGFAIVKAASKGEAIEWARKFLNVAGDGVSTIFELYDEAAFSEK